MKTFIILCKDEHGFTSRIPVEAKTYRGALKQLRVIDNGAYEEYTVLSIKKG